MLRARSRARFVCVNNAIELTKQIKQSNVHLHRFNLALSVFISPSLFLCVGCGARASERTNGRSNDQTIKWWFIMRQCDFYYYYRITLVGPWVFVWLFLSGCLLSCFRLLSPFPLFTRFFAFRNFCVCLCSNDHYYLHTFGLVLRGHAAAKYSTYSTITLTRRGLLYQNERCSRNARK